ncbi:uncharacterized protein LOC121234610 [Juglans microcarpa x Juglans regia]|uniref:uncharacterized protein LOC121234610 n=1 Tax=Juglans microcarpa x Juglans regia TaxID=2249226 RepID=UPI001B7DD0D3|nr:uncharacterized protein LOC121234610 [Juglans microcarpa x Juglans regia]
MDQPWLVLGDFNVIRRDSESVGGNPRPLISMLEFNDCIDHCGLLETSSSGQNMSWCNGHGGASRSWAKLDRVLMNNAFASLFPSVHFNYLSRKSYDHCMMVVFSDHLATSYGLSPFRFLNMWCLHDGFLMCVKEAWNKQDVASGLLKLSIRLKRAKLALRAWNKNVFGKVDVNIRALEERLDFLENQLQSDFSEELEDDFVATKTEIEIWEKREASRLGQIAKKKWLTEGIKTRSFFIRLLTKGDIIKEDVVEAARDFFRGAPLSRFYSSSFIVLIPKVPEPSGFDKFHPISLCSVAYKIFSKIIVNRLNSILDSLVSHEQGAFISRRSIFENITLAQKMSARGLRQGDPLSPYLFILMEEVLTRLLRKHFEEGQIGKFSHPIGAPLVSHLLYADDILIFANGGKRSIKNLMHTPDIYERRSSQQISRDKSALFLSKLISTSRKRSLLSLTGFKEGKFPVTYLGVPLFAFRILSSNNLWSDFFRAKYLRHGHFSTYKARPIDSRFWRSIVKMLPKVMDNVNVLVRGGNASFWFDRWLASGPLSIHVEDVINNGLRLQDCWSNNLWDEDFLRELVSEEVVEEILQMPINDTRGPDLFVWKPSTNGRFSTRTAWEVVRKRGQELPWHDWFWHQLLPKRISICLWKIWMECLPVDIQVQRKGVSLASACDCCDRR